jgi:SanA protein
MKRRLLRLIIVIFLGLSGAAALGTFIINIVMIKGTEKYVYRDIEAMPSKTAVLVLGSQIRAGSLSPVLRDRVEGGIALLRQGKGRKLLLSGDHGQMYYDEVNAMRL